MVDEELGKLQGKTLTRLPLGRAPVDIKEQLKQELSRLENTGVIQPVGTPSQWLSSLAVVVYSGRGIKKAQWQSQGVH